MRVGVGTGGAGLRWPLFAFALLPLAGAGGAAFAAAPVLPKGAQVVAGTAAIGRASGAVLTIDQSSSKAIIDWGGFSIGKGAKVVFDNGSGATLNRVTGGSVSSLQGLLSATGSVYLINPAGVIVGRSGVVDVGGTFVASTLDTPDSAFLTGGALSLAGASSAAVVNYGRIGALGGDVALVAARVGNAGSITAANGDAGLLAGYKVVLTDASLDDGRFSVLLGGAGTRARNSGLISAADAELRAEGGNVYALAGDTTGVIRATGVKSGGGKVWLMADGGTLDVAGSIEATGAGGGQIETSGAVVSLAKAAIDTHGGRWTVDPDDLEITPTAAADISTALATGDVVEQTTAGGSGGTGDITLETGADIAWSSAHSLTLSAYRNLTLDGTIELSGPGVLDLTAGTGNTGAVGPQTGAIAVNATMRVSGAGAVNLNAAYDTTTVSGASLLELSFAQGASLDYGASDQGGALSIDGQPYTLVYSMAQLAQLDGSSGLYALAGPLTAPSTPYSSAVVASFDGTLEGLGNTLTGLSIDDTADNANVGLFGILVSNAVVRDLGLPNVSITSSGANSSTGSIVGYTTISGFKGVIADVYATGTISHKDALTAGGGSYIGGVAGAYSGIIAYSYTDLRLNVGDNAIVGGVVGDLYGGETSQTLSNSAIFVSSSNYSSTAGGLAGALVSGSINDDLSTGLISAGNRVDKGGLIGFFSNGPFSNGYYDIQTSGVPYKPGATPGLTTKALQAALPSEFSPTVWGQVAGRSFPYLLNFFPAGTTPQVLSGYAYATLPGGTAAAGTSGAGALRGQTVEAVLDGSSGLGSTLTGADGYWYMLLPQGSLPKGSTVTAFLDGASQAGGASVQADVVAEDVVDPRGAVGLDLYGDTLKVQTRYAQDTLSAMEAALGAGLGTATTAAGSDILFGEQGGGLTLASGANLEVQGTVVGFSFDRDLDLGAGRLALFSSGGFSQSGGAITASGLSGVAKGAVSLADGSDRIAALGGFTGGGALQLLTTQALDVTGPVTTQGDITLTTGTGGIAIDGAVSAPVLSLDAQAGALSESTTLGAITAGTLNATAQTGITLTSPANQITTIGTDTTASGPNQITQ